MLFLRLQTRNSEFPAAEFVPVNPDADDRGRVRQFREGRSQSSRGATAGPRKAPTSKL
jgi:hypothetical protein